jgi:hypothetical protein
MNLSEFKAWFEGFTESMDGPPGEKAWKRIQDRIKSIKSDEPTTRHVFHEYYERPWRRWYNEGPWWSSVVSHSGAAMQDVLMNSVGQSSDAGLNQLAAANAVAAPANFAMSVTADEPFDAQSAFNKLGRAEALSLTHTKLRG